MLRRIRRRASRAPLSIIALTAVLLFLRPAASKAAGSQPGSEGSPPAAPAPVFVTPAAPEQGIATAKPGASLEHAISSADYVLGPGDSLLVNVWGPQPLTFPLPVTLEGKVVLPQIGVLKVDGLSLDEARDQITKALMKGFHNVTVTVTLLHVRKFQIHVLGQVARTGTYLGSAVDRVSSAVGWAGGISPKGSQRCIQVLSGDTLRARADLFAFLKRGITRANPYLHDGDVVYVPYQGDYFSVQGAVNEPGDFEYVPTDRLEDALVYAGGLTPDASRDTIEIVRYVGARFADRKPVRFYAILGGGIVPASPEAAAMLPAETGRWPVVPAALASGDDPTYPDFALRPGDEISVHTTPEGRVHRLVQVQGEVAHPGQYAILEGRTRLTDILRLAGGVTPNADLRNAQVVRREAVPPVDREYDMLSKMNPAEMTREESDYYKFRSRETPGLMVVDFVKLLQEGDSSQDILLQRGDLVNVPGQYNFVSVMGMVTSPGNVPYRPEFSPADYIQLAGGYNHRADRSQVHVIRGGSGDWLRADEAGSLRPGDSVWVLEKKPKRYWSTVKDVITVTTQIIATYIVVNQALK